MKCSCGTEFNDSFAFCPSCGKPNPTTTIPQTPLPTDAEPAINVPSEQPGQSGAKFSLKSIGIVSVILLVLAVLLLFGGKHIAAFVIGAIGVCLSKPVRSKFLVNNLALFSVIGVLVFAGFFLYLAEEVNKESHSGNSNEASVNTVGGDYSLGENVCVNDWIITVNSVDVDVVGIVTVTCKCSITNASKRNLEFVGSKLFALDVSARLFCHPEVNVYCQ